MNGLHGLSPRAPVLAILACAALISIAWPWLRRLAPAVRTASLGRWAADLEGSAWRRLAVVLLVSAAALVTLTHGDYGYNVDESWQGPHGMALVDWYGRLLSGERPGPFVAATPVMNHYGGFFELLAELAARLSPEDRTSTRHLVTAWFGVLGLWGAYLLGCALHSRAAGCLTAGLLLLTPRFFGDFFSNPKDLPFATCMTLALAALCRALPHLPRLSAGRIAWIGLAIGASMGIRVGGVLALAYVALALVAWLGRRGIAGLCRSEILPLALGGLGISFVAWTVMLVSWPWAAAAPLLRPLEALGYFQDIVGGQRIDFDVFFAGRDYLLSTVPRRFTLEFLLISMPEFALLAPLAALAPLHRLLRRGIAWPDARGMAWVLTMAAVALPLCTTASRQIIQYDGIRHFLFVVPPLCALFAASLVATLAGPAAPRLKSGLFCALLGLAGLTAWDMRGLHPYEYVYFNRTVGSGLERAATRYETDYLGLSYREGVRWVLDEYPRQPVVPTKIGSCPGFYPNLLDGLSQDPLGAARFRPVSPRDATLAVAFTRGHCHEHYSGRVLHTVARASTPLLYVIEVRRER